MSDNFSDTTRRAALALLGMQRHSWEQGVAMQAFFEMGEKDVVIAMAQEAVYRRTADGRAATIGVNDAVTDPCSVGEALLAACRWTHDPALIEGRDALIHWALALAPRSEQGVLYHLTTSRQFWADSTYMLPPFLLAAGYPEPALLNLHGYIDALMDREAGLMGHMWDDEQKRFIRSAHWGTGNGWTLAAMARMIPPLRAMGRGQDAEELAEIGRSLLRALKPFTRSDGLFHDVVDEPATFIETNLSQMIAYTIYRGCIDGWVQRSELAWADRLRDAANGQLDAYGFVKGVCGAPGFDRPGLSPEGQAFYLLMENARHRLADAPVS